MTGKLDPKVVDALLDKLASDDGFRDTFARDPAEALRLVGHVPSGSRQPGQESETLASCLKVTKLASKEAIKAARGELQKFLMSEAAHQPHRLEA